MDTVRPSIGGTLVCIASCRDTCDMDRGANVMEREVLAFIARALHYPYDEVSKSSIA